MFAEFHDNWHTTNNKELTKTVNFVGWVYCDSRHFQQYFSYIMAVIFIGGGNRSTRGKLPTCHKSLTNFITKCCIEYI